MVLVGQVRVMPKEYMFQHKLAFHSAKSTYSRLAATAEEKAAREKKLTEAVRTILDCIGEDPDREGLLRTPERYAKAIMWMTKGYEDRLAGAIWLPNIACIP